MSILEKFRSVVLKFEDVERRIVDPEIIADQSKYQEYIRQHSELKDIVQVYKDYERLVEDKAGALELLEDPEMKAMAEEEIAEIDPKMKELEQELEIFLIPKDPNDKKNAIIEIRSGTGGDEAALFASELFRMYTRYAESQNWTIDVLNLNDTGLGGIKEVSFLVQGGPVYSQLKYESGTHRVQRVPDTESQGRVHTSAATVAIMPEVEDVDIDIDTKDLRVDTFRASGAGGQHVNKTSSAIRITHAPSGIVVSCQDGRSQHQNKEKAMLMLRSRLYEAAEKEKMKTTSDLRKSQVGSGDRSEKIRTYNYPQSRVTDHRINLTLYTLEDVLQGKMQEVIDALISADNLAKMKQ